MLKTMTAPITAGDIFESPESWLPGSPESELDEWLTEYGVTLGVGALILFMIFIVWDLAKRSNAGKFGTLILYIGLAMGIVGFLIKFVITYLLENAGGVQ